MPPVFSKLSSRASGASRGIDSTRFARSGQACGDGVNAFLARLFEVPPRGPKGPSVGMTSQSGEFQRTSLRVILD